MYLKKDEAIKKIVQDKDIINCAKRITKFNILWKDLLQEMYIALYEIPEKRFRQIKKLKEYSAMIMFIMWKQKYSEFNKKYRSQKLLFTDDYSLKSNDEISHTFSKRPSYFKNKIQFHNWKRKANYMIKNGDLNEQTQARAFIIYITEKGYGRAAKKVGLPRDTIAKYVQSFKKKYS